MCGAIFFSGAKNIPKEKERVASQRNIKSFLKGVWGSNFSKMPPSLCRPGPRSESGAE